MERRIVLSNLADYAKRDLAQTFKSTAGSQPAVEPAILDDAMAALDRDGYVVFERLLPDELLSSIRDALSPLLPDVRGRNNFEGFATARVYSVIEKTFACNGLVEHPVILGLLDRILEPNYLLSQLQAIQIFPGEEAQPLHYDDAFYPWPRPRRALGAATVWAIDPFTDENGATVVLPASHTWGERTPDDDDRARARSIVMPAGSVVFFLGTLWHGGGANVSQRPRLAVSAQYCAPWCRPQENFSLSVSRERAAASSEHVQRMLGYSIHPPFMGFVDGMHPKRVLGGRK